MKKLVVAIFMCMLAVLFMAQESHALNLLMNGSFEEGNYTGGAWNRLNSGSTSLLGWTIGGDGVDWHNEIQFTSPFDGDKVIDFNLDGGTFGSIFQEFATTIGETYVLTFALGGPGEEFGLPNPRQLNVNLDGSDYIFSQQASSHTNINWGVQQLTFQAINTITRLAFSNVNSAGCWGPLVDDVSVEAAVPEPSTIVLLGIGLLGFIGLKKKLTR